LPRLLVALIVLLLFPASAHAGWIPAAAVDGPSADIVKVGNVDLARDGTGAIAYLRRDGGVPHVFVARLADGAWRAPERLDYTSGEATEVKLAVGDGHRLAIVWVADGNVYANVAGGTPFGPGPFTGPVQIGGPDARSVDVDLGVNGAAYAVWEQGGDVRSARLQDTTWNGLPPALDVDPALEAGTGRLRPKVAVSAEGYAVATWGDRTPDGATRVWARRLTGMTLSAFPQDLTIPGGVADSPDIDIEDDGSFAWVVFRQDFAGVSRTIGRRLVGSAFEPFEPMDGGIGGTEPRIDMTDRGAGYGVAQGNGGPLVVGSWLDHDHFEQPGGRLDGLDSPVPTKPEVAAADRGDIAIAWRSGATARARFKDLNVAMQPEFQVSNPGLGPVIDPGVYIGGDRFGDFVVAMVQGTEGALALTAATFDRAPGAPFIDTSEAYKRATRPLLRWRSGLELWGVQRFRVFMDGVQIGETTNDTFTPSTPLTPGRHTWQIEAVDRAGQTARSRVRTLKIDPVAPTLKVSLAGKRAAGKGLKISVKASDNAGGSGLDHITVDYGDKSPVSNSKRTTHRYKRGKFKLKVVAVDKAGNVARVEKALRIKKS
jgi:hypothetical protein